MHRTKMKAPSNPAANPSVSAASAAVAVVLPSCRSWSSLANVESRHFFAALLAEQKNPWRKVVNEHMPLLRMERIRRAPIADSTTTA